LQKIKDHIRNLKKQQYHRINHLKEQIEYRKYQIHYNNNDLLDYQLIQIKLEIKKIKNLSIIRNRRNYPIKVSF